LALKLSLGIEFANEASRLALLALVFFEVQEVTGRAVLDALLRELDLMGIHLGIALIASLGRGVSAFGAVRMAGNAFLLC
jgi:hypothetical protein